MKLKTEIEGINVLIYKRTHIGDPDKNGIFGINNCMGSVRDWEFDAVIGVGGISPWKGSEDIAKKINWIGIGANKNKVEGYENSVVAFEEFYLFEEKGILLEDIAPNLANYIFSNNIRIVKSISLNERLKLEVKDILEITKNYESINSNDNVKKLINEFSFCLQKEKISCKIC